MRGGAGVVYAPFMAASGGRGGVVLVLSRSYGAAEGSGSDQTSHLQHSHPHAHARDEAALSLHPAHHAADATLWMVKKGSLVCQC